MLDQGSKVSTFGIGMFGFKPKGKGFVQFSSSFTWYRLVDDISDLIMTELEPSVLPSAY
jgi:hypothetical protein